MGDYELSPKYEISPRYYGHKTHRREEKVYKCKECKRTFNRRHNLTKHERVHSGDKPYPCKDCGRRFADSSNLTKHINRVHVQTIKRHAIFTGKVVEEEKVQSSCAVCLRTFQTRNELFQHELKYANSKMYTCEQCNKVFHLRNSYVRHLDTHNEKRRYHCDICERTFTQKFLLEKHRQCHAPSEHDLALQLEDDYNDEYNDEDDHDEDDDIDVNNMDSAAKYESDVEGNQRERIGKGITLHECNVCKKVFTYRSLFTRHLKSHSTDNSFKCQLCNQGTKSTMSDLADPPLVPYECERCGEKFYSYKNYKNHMKAHIMSDNDVERRVMINSIYQCTVCGREYKDKSLLTKHFNAEHAKVAREKMQQRVSKPPEQSEAYPDDIRVLRTSYEYSEHHSQQAAGNQRFRGRFACPECGRELRNPAALEIHLQKFKSKKLYLCNFCEKKFHFRTSWKRHEECHKAERQVWQCDTCTLSFTQKCNLKRHKEGTKNPCGSVPRHPGVMNMRMYRDRIPVQCLKLQQPNTALVGRYNGSDEEDEDEEIDEDEADEEDESRAGAETKPDTPEPASISVDNSHIQKGEAVYACSVCDKQFTYRSLWSRHEKEHHTSKSFDCEVCGTKFTRQYYLAKHRKICVSRMNAQSDQSHAICSGTNLKKYGIYKNRCS